MHGVCQEGGGLQDSPSPWGPSATLPAVSELLGAVREALPCWAVSGAPARAHPESLRL